MIVLKFFDIDTCGKVIQNDNYQEPLSPAMRQEQIYLERYMETVNLINRNDLGTAERIRQYGVLNPIIVLKRSTGGGYELVSDHIRYGACKRLNKFDIPVIVCDLTDEEAILTMVDANLQRERNRAQSN